MVRRREDNPNQLRNQIFQLLSNSPTSPEGNVAALLQCVGQIRNKGIIVQTAEKCDLELSNFKTDDVLELYYDIKKGRRDFGYISKGWDDPGFRVGNIIEVPLNNLHALKEHTYGLMRFCATRGVAITFGERNETIEVRMDSVIYSDGFNKKVFKQVLHYLDECVERASADLRD